MKKIKLGASLLLATLTLTSCSGFSAFNNLKNNNDNNSIESHCTSSISDTTTTVPTTTNLITSDTRVECLVAFVNMGGSFVEPQAVKYGDKVEKPTNPTREGYIFKGWYEDSNYTKEFDFNTIITGTKSLYAKWEKDLEKTYYYVSFSGGETFSVKHGQTVERPQDPTREGYIFKGWYEDFECTKEFDFDTKIIDNTFIYSKWNRTYSVIFADDNKFLFETYVENGLSVSKPETPTKEHFEFLGWYKDQDLKEPYDFNTPITDNIIIYSKWEEHLYYRKKAKVDTPVIYTSIPTVEKVEYDLSRRFVTNGEISYSEIRLRTNVCQEVNITVTLGDETEEFTLCYLILDSDKQNDMGVFPVKNYQGNWYVCQDDNKNLLIKTYIYNPSNSVQTISKLNLAIYMENNTISRTLIANADFNNLEKISSRGSFEDFSYEKDQYNKEAYELFSVYELTTSWVISF